MFGAIFLTELHIAVVNRLFILFAVAKLVLYGLQALKNAQ